MPVLANARHEREVAKAMVTKLGALREIVAIMGWDNARDELSEGEFKLAAASAAVLATDAHPIQKAACAVILDMLVAGWREIAPLSVLGAIVERNDPLVRKWRANVLANDNWACQECGSASELHAHHVVRWVDAPHLRIIPGPCHVAVHSSGLNLIKA